MEHHRAGVLHQQAVAIAESHIGAAEGLDALVGEQYRHAVDDLRHLAAVGARVHAYAAADAAGDAVGKFQPRQALLAGEVGHTGQRRACVGSDAACVAQADACHVAGIDDQAIHLAIREQHVGAVAQQKRTCAALVGKVQQKHQLLGILGKGHSPSRTADAERGVLRQRFLRLNGQVRQIVPQFFVQLLIPTHTAPPCSGCFR